jgi:hypothetical protein
MAICRSGLGNQKTEFDNRAPANACIHPHIALLALRAQLDKLHSGFWPLAC